MELPLVMGNYASSTTSHSKAGVRERLTQTLAAASCTVKFIILIVFSRYLSAAVPLIGTVLYFLQRFYLQTSRQVRLLGIEVKAPLYALISDTVSGGSTIRAFGWECQYQATAYDLINTLQRPEYLQNCTQIWLAFVLDTVMAAVTVVLVSTIVTWRSKFGAGDVGISLVMTVGFGSQLARLIVNWTKMESSIGAVARIKRFASDTPSMSGVGSKGASSEDWPSHGRIAFENVEASYQ